MGKLLLRAKTRHKLKASLNIQGGSTSEKF